MPPSEMKVRNIKPKNKSYKLTDSKGFYLYVTETGGKPWRFKYRVDNDGKGKKKSYLPSVKIKKYNICKLSFRKAGCSIEYQTLTRI
ncbi:MAG: Arm DNA-binding domain-containing protein [Smithella sp.]